MASLPFASPFAHSAIQRAAVLSYAVVDEVHTLIDQPYIPRRLDPRVRRLGVAGLIAFGTLISTLGKLAYEVQATGRDGIQRPFEKPWFLVLLMFIGMSLNLPLSLFLDLVRRSKRRFRKLISRHRAVSVEPLYAPLLPYDPDDADEMFNAPPVAFIPPPATPSHPQRFTLLDKHLLVLLTPTLFDLLGSALLNIGLLSVTASATAMLRQSLLLFAALLGVGMFKKKLNRLHLAGLGGCTAGLLMVSAASLASGVGGSAAVHRGTMAGGIALILASQMVAAGQLLLDQSVYTNRLQLSPLKVVGCQGMLGAVITVLLLLLLDASSIGPEGWGLSEDSWDSLIMIVRSPLLLVLLLVYTGSLQAYNICGMAVSGELTAVDTALLQAVRTLFVWIINLLIWAVAAALTPDTADQARLSHIGGTGVHRIGGSNSSPPILQHDVGTVLQAQLQQQQQWGRGWGGVDPGAMAAAAAADLSSAAAGVLPGEPWVRWSFLQAAGFLILVVAAITYSKGDNERLRRQMEDEAALIMLDQPPSVAGSVTSNRIFTAHMDIDTASYLKSFARRQNHDDMIYGITPVPSVRSGSGHREGCRSSRESREGLEPLLSALVSGTSEGLDSGSAVQGLGSSPDGGFVLNLQPAFDSEQQVVGVQQQASQQVVASTAESTAERTTSLEMLPQPAAVSTMTSSGVGQAARLPAEEVGRSVELSPASSRTRPGGDKF